MILTGDTIVMLSGAKGLWGCTRVYVRAALKIFYCAQDGIVGVDAGYIFVTSDEACVIVVVGSGIYGLHKWEK